MSCKLDINLLQDLLEGNLQPLEKIIIEEHLKTCSNCKKELLALKLLLWELDEIKKTKLDIPTEVLEVREKVLSQLFEGSQYSMKLSKVIEMQRKNISNAGMFIKFIPGVKTGENYLKQGINRVPSAVLSLSGSVLKGSFKLLQARFLA